MFDFADAPGPVRPDIGEVARRVWDHLARPGTWWTASQRLAIAALARAARTRRPLPAVDLPAAATEAAALLAATPARTTEAWVGRMVEVLGEEAYVELLGVTTRVVALDTFTRLMGAPLEPLPEPRPGEPTRVTVDPRPARMRSWVAMGATLIPPATLSLVPDENDMTNTMVWTLYMTDVDMEGPDFRRGDLHRTQMELVAATVSYQNECFY